MFKLIGNVKGHDGRINALCISKNGMFIATGGADRAVKLWDFVKIKENYEKGDMEDIRPFLVYQCDSVINS